MWRMYLARCRFLRGRRLVNQVASIIIQTMWRNSHYRTLTSNENYQQPKVVLDVFIAAEMIQLCWRSFCNRRIYRYFRDLILLKLKGAPNDLLRSIIPNESDLLDKAAGVHARFRLGGWVFPPKVFFKIYTHRSVFFLLAITRNSLFKMNYIIIYDQNLKCMLFWYLYRPLCDVNSFAPRDYTSEKPVDAMQLHNHFEKLREEPKHITAVRVGARYFGAIVSTTSTVGTKNWYQREERNNWRAIASHMFENISLPPWFQEVAHDNRPKPFHFSQLKRRQDLAKQKKRRRREWMMKAYMMTHAATTSHAEEKEQAQTLRQGRGQDFHSSARQHNRYQHSVASPTADHKNAGSCPAMGRSAPVPYYLQQDGSSSGGGGGGGVGSKDWDNGTGKLQPPVALNQSAAAKYGAEVDYSSVAKSNSPFKVEVQHRPGSGAENRAPQPHAYRQPQEEPVADLVDWR